MFNPSELCGSIAPEQILETLAEIALQIQQEIKVDEIAGIVVQACRAQLQTDRVIVYQLVPQKTAVVLAESVRAEATPLLGSKIANACATATWVERYQEHPWSEISEISAREMSPCYQEILAHFQVQANLVVPILAGGSLWGLLIAHQGYAHTWQRLEVQFLQQMALHLGVRIHHLADREAAESALCRYERIVNATPDCVALIDRRYIYRAINQTYERWYNKSSAQILGSSMRDLLGEALFEQLKPQLDRCLVGETNSWSGWFTYPGIGRRFVRAVYTPGLEPDGTVSGIVSNVHDLTDLKHIEETLAESEERFRQMADNIQEVFWMANIDFTQMLYISPAYETIWKRSCASLYAKPKSFLKSVHPEDWAHVVNNVEQHRQTGFSHEYRILQPDGAIRWIWEQAFPVYDATGQPYRLVGISQDITDRKLAEARLRLSEEQRRLALDLNQFGSWDGNVLTGEVVWSEQMYTIMGFAQGDPKHMSWRDRLFPEDLAKLEAVIKQSQENHTSFSCEYRVVHPDGSIHWILARGQTLYDELNRPARILGIVMDISDRKQLEIALRNSEERYRQIVETATEGIWVLDAKNTTTFVNPCMTAMLGYTEQEMMGKSLFDFMDEAGKAHALEFLKRRRSGMVERHDFRFRHKDGSEVWTLISTRPLWDESGAYAGALGMLADITQRKLDEFALQQQTQREQALNRVLQVIRNSLELNTIFATATTETAHLLNVERVQIAQYLPDRQCWRIVSSFQQAGLANLIDTEIPEVDNPFSAQLKRGECVRVEDTDQLSERINREAAQIFPGAWLLMPLIHQGVIWGSLTVNSIQHPFCWSESQVALVQVVADQLAIAIQQANLYHQTQLELTERQRAEAALQQLNQQLEQRVQERTQALKQQAEQERLLRLSIQNIHRSLDLNEIFATVLNETRQTLQTDRVAIYQFTADWSGYFVAESVGEEWVLLVGEGIQTVWQDTYLQETQGGQYRNNQIRVVNDIYAGELTQCHIEILEQFQVRAYATIPIFVDDQLWGLLAAYHNRGPHQWQAWEVSLLQQISLQLAIAMRQSRLYQAAQQQVRELEKLHQLKDDFLSTVSHELRSPLANIKMATQMVELRLNQDQIQDARLIQYIQILKESCQQELLLINDLLDLQRLEAGRQVLEVESIDLNQWLPALVEAFKARIQEQHQHLNLNLPANLPGILTDAGSLKRIVTELLHNACKYTPPHEYITVAVWTRHENVYIQVSNSGVELPIEELPRLFEKFYRVADVDRWKHGGTGLGLALVKRLVEHLHGSIEVRSENSLIHFTIQLPLQTQS